MLTPLLLVALLAKPPAPDTAGPTIDHTPVASATKGAEVVINATIKDPSGVFGPTVYYRSKGDPKFSALELNSQGGGAYATTVPSAKVTKDLEYYVEAYDENGNGPTRVGDPDKPLVVAVQEPKKEEPVVEEKKPEETQGETVASTEGETKGGEESYLLEGGDGEITVDDGSSATTPMGPIVTAGTGAVALIAGIALYFSASSTVASIDEKYAGVDAEYRKLRQPADADAIRSAIGTSRIGSVLMIGGVLAAGGGAAWYLLPRMQAGSGGELTFGLDGRF